MKPKNKMFYNNNSVERNIENQNKFDVTKMKTQIKFIVNR